MKIEQARIKIKNWTEKSEVESQYTNENHSYLLPLVEFNPIEKIKLEVFS